MTRAGDGTTPARVRPDWVAMVGGSTGTTPPSALNTVSGVPLSHMLCHVAAVVPRPIELRIDAIKIPALNGEVGALAGHRHR